ncbi:serine protease inhibitor [Lentinula raphanica]|nr:serine protease inhibitor [Lentinula raphanica]KAJ3755063.1 serine protease inhibitor [Lentinula raphanica]KAJ3826486.1 serine protease inhibitor [Lentinula raphanica]KAJ3966002.1 serine protease inhibitor [Lentinula raphanica]
MSLETGRYIIYNREYAVGRRLAEDLSLAPKEIVLTSQEQQTTWIFEKTGNQENEYSITSNHSPTAHIEGYVFALLTEFFSATKWIVERVPQHGDNAYIILTPGRDQGWTAADDIYDRITVGPLITTNSYPPQYHPKSVFQILNIE